MKENYQALCDGVLAKIAESLAQERYSKNDGGAVAGEQKKPRLLLHACCAPCSSWTLEYLLRYFDITVYYYNPNIHPKEEYARRLEELKQFLPRFLQNQNASASPGAFAELKEADYIPAEFFEAVQAERDNLTGESERGERCRRCYQLRMQRAYEYARKNAFDWFTTTLSISPHKDAQMINQIGFALEQSALALDSAAPKFLAADFKKKNGYKRSLELSREYGLYRQDYCGCIYSLDNSRKK